MKNIAIKLAIFTFLSIITLSCGNDKKDNKTPEQKEEVKEKTKAEKKAEEKAYYKTALEYVLNSSSEYAYFKGETGVSLFIKGDEVVCFLDTKEETESIYDDRFFVNVYSPSGKESLAFEFMDFEKDDINIDGTDYMLTAFNFPGVEATTSIQVGQYSKELKKITWKVLIPKGRFHK